MRSQLVLHFDYTYWTVVQCIIIASVVLNMSSVQYINMQHVYSLLSSIVTLPFCMTITFGLGMSDSIKNSSGSRGIASYVISILTVVVACPAANVAVCDTAV